MGFGLYREIAASGARLGSLSWFGVNRAAHRWRAGGLPGIVVVPELACGSCAVTDPRPRALKSVVELEAVGRAELAGGGAARCRRVYEVASGWLSVSGRVDARDSKVHCWSVVCPRAVGGRLHLRVTSVVKFARAEYAQA